MYKKPTNLQVHIPDELKMETKVLAVQNGKTLAEMVEELLRKGIASSKQTPSRAGHPAPS